jgi:hypothetical protein
LRNGSRNRPFTLRSRMGNGTTAGPRKA